MNYMDLLAALGGGLASTLAVRAVRRFAESRKRGRS